MKLLKNASLMSVAVMISRFLGLIREQLMSFLFGAGFVTDAYFVAFRIPNLFRDLFAEGALSTAFVSVFSKEKNKKSSIELTRFMGSILSLILLLVCVALFIMAPFWVEALASDFKLSPGKFELTVLLTRILSFFLFFVSFAALSMGILNSRGHYFIPALGSAAFNLTSILIAATASSYCIFVLEDKIKGIIVFSVGTLIGALSQWAVQWKSLKKESIPVSLGVWNFYRLHYIREALKDERIRRVFWMFLPAVITVGAVQVNVVVNTFFATKLDQGSVSWLYFAFRLVHFPMGVFGVSLFMAALPELSKKVGKKKEFNGILGQATQLSLILGLGSGMGLWVMGRALVALIYERGAFSDVDTLMTAQALSAYALGLLAFSLTKIWVSVFYALEKIWIPTAISLGGVFFNYFLCGYLSQLWGHVGVALSVSFSAWFGIFLLGLSTYFQGYAPLGKDFLKLLLGIFLALIPMACFQYAGAMDFLFQLRHQYGVLVFSLVTFIVIGILGLSYLFIVSFFSQEGRLILKKFRLLK